MNSEQKNSYLSLCRGFSLLLPLLTVFLIHTAAAKESFPVTNAKSVPVGTWALCSTERAERPTPNQPIPASRAPSQQPPIHAQESKHFTKRPRSIFRKFYDAVTGNRKNKRISGGEKRGRSRSRRRQDQGRGSERPERSTSRPRSHSQNAKTQAPVLKGLNGEAPTNLVDVTFSGNMTDSGRYPTYHMQVAVNYQDDSYLSTRSTMLFIAEDDLGIFALQDGDYQQRNAPKV